MKQNSVWDYFTMAFVNSGSAIPNFLVSTLLIYFFAVKWGDVTTSDERLGQRRSAAGRLDPARDRTGHAPMTIFARIVRGSVLETVQQDYIRTAKAKGLRRRRVVGLHILRNSLIPAVTARAAARLT